MHYEYTVGLSNFAENPQGYECCDYKKMTCGKQLCVGSINQTITLIYLPNVSPLLFMYTSVWMYVRKSIPGYNQFTVPVK